MLTDDELEIMFVKSIEITRKNATSAETLEELHAQWKTVVAAREQAPIETFSAEKEFLEVLAQHPNTPVHVLRSLYENCPGVHGRYVRIRLAENWNTPSDILASLFDDEDFSHIRVLARNPNTPAEILRKAATELYSFARLMMAGDPTIMPEALLTLLKDEATETRTEAYRTLQRLPEYAGMPLEWLLEMAG